MMITVPFEVLLKNQILLESQSLSSSWKSDFYFLSIMSNVVGIYAIT